KLLPVSVDSKNISLDSFAPTIEFNTEESRHDIHLYTDGSCAPDGKVGGGYIAYQAGLKVVSDSLAINRHVEPIDIELIAISHGLTACISSAHTRFANNIIVHTNNRSAAGIVNGKTSLTCRKEVENIRDIQKKWNERVRLAHVSTGCILAHWVPSHSRVSQNEEADRLAKAGTIKAYITSSG
ncbi:hypothetical protein EPUL_006615, partial [Erysiphe pulchra]